jgi:UDPglucose 6-dehydrogenase
MSKVTVGFAGMTHLGLNSAIATAERGFDIVGYDADAAVIGRLQRHDPPIVEPDLPELLAKNTARLSFTSDAASLKSCDVVYIAADVPTDDQAGSDLTPIRALIGRVIPHLGPKSVLVILCQVPPGFTRSISGVPPDRLIYQVETLIFGRAIDRALNPERFIVGCADPSAQLPVSYQTQLDAFGCPILKMRYESAELAKISINFCLVASVSVANVLAEVSERIGADWAEIAPALKLDKRIGPHAYLSPGLGISGGNLERDLRTVIDIADRTDADVRIVKAWIANSGHRKDWCWRTLEGNIKRGAKIAVLGLAYKENTHSTKNSPALVLLDHLKGYDVRVHDPVVSAAIVPFAKGCADPLACAEGADALVIATPWPDYRAIALDQLARRMAGRIIIDPYRMLDGRKAAKLGFTYHTLGMPALTPQGA